MKTLQEFLEKRDGIFNIINQNGVMGVNGINVLTSMVSSLNNQIENNDYSGTKFRSLFDTEAISRGFFSEEEINELKSQFDDFMKDLPEIKNKLNFNFVENFNTLFEKENFVEEWNALNDEQKSDILYIDKEMYKIIRQKIDVKDFNFLFKTHGVFNDEYPLEILEWVNAPANSKVIFYKLRKNSKDTIYEDFFNSFEVKNSESEDSDSRNKIANEYLNNNKDLETFCWYKKLDMCLISDYKYSFFKKLEDEFNGYDKVKENIQLPDILKKWSGKNYDEELYKHENELFSQDLKFLTKEDSDPQFQTIANKYPTIKIKNDLQKKLEKKDFFALLEESKGTEFEEFFSQAMTEKMSLYMPYRRIDYMFVYFRDKFTSDAQKKPKLR